MTVDKNYMLLIITDRAIDAICFFETHEEAYQAMLSDFAGCIDYEITDLIPKKGIYDDEDWYFDDYGAWSNLHNTDVDWDIIDLTKARENDRISTL